MSRQSWSPGSQSWSPGGCWTHCCSHPVRSACSPAHPAGIDNTDDTVSTDDTDNIDDIDNIDDTDNKYDIYNRLGQFVSKI